LAANCEQEVPLKRGPAELLCRSTGGEQPVVAAPGRPVTAPCTAGHQLRLTLIGLDHLKAFKLRKPPRVTLAIWYRDRACFPRGQE
jgi:hypothetical protein